MAASLNLGELCLVAFVLTALTAGMLVWLWATDLAAQGTRAARIEAARRREEAEVASRRQAEILAALDEARNPARPWYYFWRTVPAATQARN